MADSATRVLLITRRPEEGAWIRGMLKHHRHVYAGSSPFRLSIADPQAADAALKAAAVVLLDLEGMTGKEAGAVVGPLVGAEGPPVLLLICEGEEALVRQVARFGVKEYLVKEQLNQAWLHHALHYVLERQALLQELHTLRRQPRVRADHFHRITEQNADGILVLDAKGIIQFANQAAQTLLQRTRDELQGSLWSYPIVYGQPVELDVATRGGDHRIAEMRMVKLDGEGDHLFLASLRDITERWHVKEQLEQTAERLRRSNDELRRFAHVAGHDLREPLRSIRLYLQLLEENYGDQVGEEAHYFMASAVQGAQRMRQLINDLLEYTRLDIQDIQLEPVDVGVLVQEVLTSMRAALEESQAIVTVEEMPVVQGDSSKLEQLFQNLLSNAVKFRQAGTVPEIRITAEAVQGEWRFEVADNGIGIPEAFRGRVFEMFERLNDREEYPGTGIGLAICEKIILQHGGRIWVEDTASRGATFRFTLPAAPLLASGQPEATA